MRSLTILAFLCFCCFELKAEPLPPWTSYRRKSEVWRTYAAGGIAFGQETFFGARGGLYLGAKFPLALVKQYWRPGKSIYGFPSAGWYMGVEGSLMVFFAGIFSASATTGFVVKPLSVDINVAHTILCSAEGITNSYNTLNPKVGLNIGPVWLKAGPSYLLGNDETIWGDNFMTWRGTSWNIELLYQVEL